MIILFNIPIAFTLMAINVFYFHLSFTYDSFINLISPFFALFIYWA